MKENRKGERSPAGFTSQQYTPLISSASLRNLEAKQDQIMDILKSIAPAKLNGDNREITDKLTNVYHHATPKSRASNPSDRELHNDNPIDRKRMKYRNPSNDGVKQDYAHSFLLTNPSDETKDHSVDRKQGFSTFSPTGFTQNLVEPYLSQDPPSSTQSRLDQNQIKDLLALTKIAEITAIKKQGVSHPGGMSHPVVPTRPSKSKKKVHSRVQTLLKKPHIRGLLKFLIGSKKSKDLLKFLRSSYDEAMERTQDLEKRHELSDKYNKALHKLLELWNKRLLKPEGELLLTRSVNENKQRGTSENENPLRVG